MNLGDYQKRLLEGGDSYKQMVLALRAFSNEMLFDDVARSSLPAGVVHCGRKMTTSQKNRHSPLIDVTPDLVVQPSATYGLIAECKWGVPRNNLFARHAEETAEQLEKYDDDLTGWPLANSSVQVVPTHDLVLLVNHEDSKRLAKELASRMDQGSLQLTRNFAIVGIGQFKRAQGLWTELDLEHGRLSDANKTDKLSNRLPINPATLARNPQVALVELADTVPPIPVMMELIHKASIQNLTRDQHEQHRLDGQVKQTVELKELCDWVGRFAFRHFDKRDPACPHGDWVREAMAVFVAMNWAERPDHKRDEWVYLHKKGRKTPYAKFLSFCAKREFREDLTRKSKEKRDAGRQAKMKLAAAEKEKRRQEREEQKKSRLLEKAVADAPLFAEQLRKNPPTLKKK